MSEINDKALVDPSAKIAEGVRVGPWSIIGPEVEIGKGTIIDSHVVIKGPTKIGCDNHFFSFSSIGEVPQDKKFQGEVTHLEIGDRNVFREFCTVNRGTAQDKSTTQIGSDNLFMAYVHIAHDCEIGNHTIFANGASLAGHVKVEDHATLGGFVGVLQFCRIGAYSFASMSSIIIKDVPPFIKVSGYYAKPFGLNVVGLQRHGFADETISNLKKAYKIIYRQGLTIENALAELQSLSDQANVKQLREFIQASNTGIIR